MNKYDTWQLTGEILGCPHKSSLKFSSLVLIFGYLSFLHLTNQFLLVLQQWIITVALRTCSGHFVKHKQGAILDVSLLQAINFTSLLIMLQKGSTEYGVSLGG